VNSGNCPCELSPHHLLRCEIDLIQKTQLLQPNFGTAQFNCKVSHCNLVKRHQLSNASFVVSHKARWRHHGIVRSKPRSVSEVAFIIASLTALHFVSCLTTNLRHEAKWHHHDIVRSKPRSNSEVAFIIASLTALHFVSCLTTNLRHKAKWHHHDIVRSKPRSNSEVAFIIASLTALHFVSCLTTNPIIVVSHEGKAKWRPS